MSVFLLHLHLTVEFVSAREDPPLFPSVICLLGVNQERRPLFLLAAGEGDEWSSSIISPFGNILLLFIFKPG